MNIDHQIRLNSERWKLVGLTPNVRMDIAWKDPSIMMIAGEQREELHIDFWGDGSDEHFERLLKLTRSLRQLERRVNLTI
jgi:hypothetical protein